MTSRMNRALFIVFQRPTFGTETTSLYYLENSVTRERFSEPRVHFALNCVSLGIPGFCLLMAVQRVPIAWMAVGLHILMLSVVAITLKRGIEVANCGCFGVFLARPLTTSTLMEDAVMLAMSLLVLLDARRRTGEFGTFLSNDGPKYG